jgi:hypothetical protein
MIASLSKEANQSLTMETLSMTIPLYIDFSFLTKLSVKTKCGRTKYGIVSYEPLVSAVLVFYIDITGVLPFFSTHVVLKSHTFLKIRQTYDLITKQILIFYY